MTEDPFNPNPIPDPNEIPIEAMEGNLLHNLVLFGRILRELGVDVNPGRVMEVTQALAHIEIWRPGDFYHTLRSMMITQREDIEQFDEAFELFWKKPSDGSIDFDLQTLLSKPQMGEEPETIITPPPIDPPDEDEEEIDEGDEEIEQEIFELTQTWSQQEILANKDFGDMTPAELASIQRLMTQLIWRLGERKTRRMKPGKKGVLDIRSSLRRNFRYGGELIEWKYKDQKIKPRPLVIIADISGSMERYSRLLLHFLYSLSIGMDQPVEAFTFGTRLTHITRQLRNKDVDQAITDVTAEIDDWSGGTRIGEAMQTFNFDWSRRVLRGGAIVLLISDGWDRGDPDLLGREMARLHRFCHRMVWLNPLLGSDEYEPLTRGMVAAMPYIDDFLPVHNLNSLELLAQHLKALDDPKNKRRGGNNLKGAAFIDNST
ncbi:MAG: VWA domain-containing protein [Anaerolineae bacterium]